METWDVVVVGAGLAGCSVAWHAAPHARVLVLERAERPGSEASAQNAGLVRRLADDPFERALALRTAEWFDEPGDDWASPPSRRTGAVLGLARDAWHLHDGAAHLLARGVRIEACDRPAEVAPALTGSALSFAWWMPDERVAEPAAMLDGFVRGARRQGAEIRCGVTVGGLLLDGERVVGVATDRGTIGAGRVVVAGGAWTAEIAGGSFVPVRRSLFRTAPHPLAQRDHPWVWIDDVGLYVRPDAGAWLGSPCDEAIDHAGAAGPLTVGARGLAAEKLVRWLPAIDAPIVSGWSGLRTFAPDRRPVLGDDPRAPGLAWAAGLGGSGVTCAYAVGEAVAAWLRGAGVPWLRPEPVSPARPMPRAWHIRPTGDLDQTRVVT